MRFLITIALLAALAAACFGQSNFVTTKQTARPDIANAVVHRAAQVRREMSLAWFGTELADWDTPCRIHWFLSETPTGVTLYERGTVRPAGMTMRVHGSYPELMSDVIPHEVMHLVLRDHIGSPLPRWMDEGACSTVESDDSLTKLERKLIECLKAGRVLPLPQTLQARDYPRDATAFYAQSASLSRWLINQGGTGRFIALARISDADNSGAAWTNAFKEAYGYESLAEVQSEWLKWVEAGSPEIAPIDDDKYHAARFGTRTQGGLLWRVVQRLREVRYNSLGRRFAKVKVKREIPRAQAPYRPTPYNAPSAPSQGTSNFSPTIGNYNVPSATTLTDCSTGNCRIVPQTRVAPVPTFPPTSSYSVPRQDCPPIAGAKGDKGDKGDTYTLTDQDKADIAAMVSIPTPELPPLPKKPVKIVDADTGDVLIEVVMDLNTPDEVIIPYRKDDSDAFGDAEREQIAEAIAAVEINLTNKIEQSRPTISQLVAEMTDTDAEALAEKLPAVELQPEYKAKDGTLLPSGKPLLAKLGSTLSIPPMGLKVIDPSGVETVTQGQLGGMAVINMQKKIPNNE